MVEARDNPISGASTQLPFISIVVVARGAAGHVVPCLESLRTQDYPQSRREFLLVYGDCPDGTREAFETWRDGPARNEQVTILPNLKRILAAGWNVALAAANGDVIVRLDAHARAEPDFLRRAAEVLMQREESIVGGPRPSISPTDWQGLIVGMAERSLFGSGQAAYRRRTMAGYVDTLAHAAYHRRVFRAIGGYDERLGRNQDLECHHRMRRAGFRFYFDPSIVSVHLARSTFKGMLRQKFSNGYWMGLIMGITPQCFAPRHFVPGLFVLAILVVVVLAAVDLRWPLLALAVSYGLCAVTASIMEAGRAGKARNIVLAPLLPPVFLAMHLANGLGTLCGLAVMPMKRRRWRGYEVPWPIQPDHA